MNFQTMSKQRKFILIAAAIGIIAMFLPWIDAFVIKANGMHGKGIIVFLCFAAAGVMAYMGDQTKNLDKTPWFITLICGAIATLMMILFYSDASSNSIVGSLLAYGFYIAAIASIGLLAVTYLFRSAGDSIKGGLDKLKDTIEQKTKSDNPPNTNS